MITDETKEKLLDHFKTQRGIAEFVGKTPACITYWLNSKKIPIQHAAVLAKETGISFYDLRTDIPRDE